MPKPSLFIPKAIPPWLAFFRGWRMPYYSISKSKNQNKSQYQNPNELMLRLVGCIFDFFHCSITYCHTMAIFALLYYIKKKSAMNPPVTSSPARGLFGFWVLDLFCSIWILKFGFILPPSSTLHSSSLQRISVPYRDGYLVIC